MKFTLTIEGDNYSELQRIAAVISGADATDNKADTVTISVPADRFPPKPDNWTKPVSEPVSSITVQPAPVPNAPDNWAPSAPVAAEPIGDDPTISPPMYDRAGMPWDKRIHSESRSQNADGTWRKRRGVDAAVIQHVEAELRGNAPAAPSMPAIPPPPAHADHNTASHGPVQTPGPVPAGNYPSTIPMHPTHASAPVSASTSMVPVAPIAQPPAVTSTAILPATTAAVTSELSMSSIMTRVSPAMSSGKLTQHDLAGLCAQISQQIGKTINSIVDCMHDQNALQVCSDLLTARGI